MLKANFDDVRRAPKGRAAVFIPELLLMRELSKETKIVDSRARNKDDIYENALFTLIPQEPTSTERSQSILNLIKNVKHVEDLDPYILVISAYIRVTYGSDPTNSENTWLIPQQALSNSTVISLIDAAIDKRGFTRSKDIKNAIMADLLYYYGLIYQAQ